MLLVPRFDSWYREKKKKHKIYSLLLSHYQETSSPQHKSIDKKRRKYKTNMHSYVPYSSNTTVNENRWKSSHNKSYTGTASHGNTKSPSYANSTSRFGNDTNKQNLKPGSTRFGNNVTKQNLRPSSTRFGSDITKQNIRPSSYGTSKQNLRPTSSRMGGNDTLKQSLRPMALRRGSNSGRMFDYEKAEVKILNTFEDDNLAASMYGGSTKSSKKNKIKSPKKTKKTISGYDWDALIGQ